MYLSKANYFSWHCRNRCSGTLVSWEHWNICSRNSKSGYSISEDYSIQHDIKFVCIWFYAFPESIIYWIASRFCFFLLIIWWSPESATNLCIKDVACNISCFSVEYLRRKIQLSNLFFFHMEWWIWYKGFSPCFLAEDYAIQHSFSGPLNLLQTYEFLRRNIQLSNFFFSSYGVVDLIKIKKAFPYAFLISKLNVIF